MKALIFFLFSLLILIVEPVWSFEEPDFTVQGHRGARNIFPENSLEGFEYAILQGAHYIELDVHVTKDGHLVLFHDPTVTSRICLDQQARPLKKSVAVFQSSLEDLKKFDCGQIRKNGYPLNIVPGATIPSFDELVDLVKRTPGGDRVLFKVDIKAGKNRKHYPAPVLLAERVLEAIHRHGLTDRTVHSSFDLEVLSELRRQDPTSRVAVLSATPVGKSLIQKALAIGAYAISPHHRALQLQGAGRAVARIQSYGLKVIPWTVNGPQNWERMLEAGVDGIITDDPAGLLDHLKFFRDSGWFSRKITTIRHAAAP